MAVLSYPDLELKATSLMQREITFPYVPGLLSFREIPALLDCLQRLEVVPDVFICDGLGIAHPRRCGLACHLGVLFDLPSIGAAKHPLIGMHEPVPQERGAWRALVDESQIVGGITHTVLHPSHFRLHRPSDVFGNGNSNSNELHPSIPPS